jgi:hypothetical protein
MQFGNVMKIKEFHFMKYFWMSQLMNSRNEIPRVNMHESKVGNSNISLVLMTPTKNRYIQKSRSKTHELKIEESVQILFRTLERDGILVGAPKVAPPGLPNPDGDFVVDLHVPDHLKHERMEEAKTLPKVLITDIDLNWLQTIGEGWASPLKGFMREGTLLETLHFQFHPC